MTRTVTLFQFMPYGAPELQSVARPYMLRALLLSTALSVSLFAALGLVQTMSGTLLPPNPPPIILVRPPLPPSLAPAPATPQVTPAAPNRAALGIPVPKPDAEVPIENTIAPQDVLRTVQPGVGEGEGDRPLVVEQPATPETTAGWDVYKYVDELPAPVHQVVPDYPTLAKEAGVTGVVTVHLLVGRDGHVRDVQVDPKHGILLLNDAAIAAARQWVFTPARTNGHPVEVWVTVPFNFHLQ
jgi:protein TonB